MLKRGGHFLCLEFSRVDLPVLDRIYDAYSFAAIPPIGKVVTGDGGAYRYLVEFDPQVPAPELFAEMIGEAGFAPRGLHPLERGDRRDPLGLEALIVGILVVARPRLKADARCFRVRPRRGVCRRRSNPLAPGAEAAARVGQLDCETRRRWAGGPVPGDRSIGAVLRQAGAIPFDATRHRRRQGRLGARAAAGPGRADESGDGGRDHRGLFRREDRIVVREFRRARGGRFNRPSPSRRGED